jgi:hypothetical protein
MLEVINEKKNLCNLAGCQLLPEHPIDMGGPEAMPMEPMMDMDMGGMDMDMGMPEIDFD